MNERIPNCPFKAGSQPCEGSCPSHGLVVSYQNLDEERADFVKTRDNPMLAINSEYVEEKFSKEIRRLLILARGGCVRLNPLQKLWGKIEDWGLK